MEIFQLPVPYWCWDKWKNENAYSISSHKFSTTRIETNVGSDWPVQSAYHFWNGALFNKCVLITGTIWPFFDIHHYQSTSFIVERVCCHGGVLALCCDILWSICLCLSVSKIPVRKRFDHILPTIDDRPLCLFWPDKQLCNVLVMRYMSFLMFT